MHGDQKPWDVVGESGGDQGMQAECHTRQFGPESSRHQGRSVHGSDLLRCLFRGQ